MQSYIVSLASGLARARDLRGERFNVNPKYRVFFQQREITGE